MEKMELSNQDSHLALIVPIVYTIRSWLHIYRMLPGTVWLVSHWSTGPGDRWRVNTHSLLLSGPGSNWSGICQSPETHPQSSSWRSGPESSRSWEKQGVRRDWMYCCENKSIFKPPTSCPCLNSISTNT